MSNEILIGDCREELKNLADSSIDCIMTSPPYWGLRDYGHEDQIGLEPTPKQYLDNLIGVFDECKRVLKKQGNCFVNLGDTYSGTCAKKQGNCDKSKQRVHRTEDASYKGTVIEFPPSKSMCMIPERFAWGMIEHGWILRNKIVWYKPNHMPESVTDRLTKSYEMVYHFVKSKKYYYDLDAIREMCITNENMPHGIVRSLSYNGKYKGNNLNPELVGSPRARTQRKVDKTSEHFIKNGSGGNVNLPSKNEKGKNPGDVWSINTRPYKEAHFAVFPLELIRRPILAGCPEGGIVLDPFGGSGTVAEFCRHNNRNSILIELNDEYRTLIESRSMKNIIPLDKYCCGVENVQ